MYFQVPRHVHHTHTDWYEEGPYYPNPYDSDRAQEPQRPERPTRTYVNNPLLTPPLIFTMREQRGSRDELPRPNAPVHDINYNNRSGGNRFTIHYSPQNYQQPQPQEPEPEVHVHLDQLLFHDPNTVRQMPVVNVTEQTARSSRGQWRTSPYARPSLAVESARECQMTSMVLNALECPVCRDHVTPPILQCIEGHILCSSCRNRITCCPVCRGEFISTRLRVLETLAQAVKYPCPYDGCGEQVRLTERPQHSAECSHRIFDCLYDQNCRFSGKKDQLYIHGIHWHRPQTWPHSKIDLAFNWSSTSSNPDQHMLFFDGKIFKVKALYQRSFLEISIVQICSYQERSEFNAILKFTSEDQLHQILLSAPTLTENTTNSQLSTFKIHTETLINMKRSDDIVRFAIELKQQERASETDQDDESLIPAAETAN